MTLCNYLLSHISFNIMRYWEKNPEFLFLYLGQEKNTGRIWSLLLAGHIVLACQSLMAGEWPEEPRSWCNRKKQQLNNSWRSSSRKRSSNPLQLHINLKMIYLQTISCFRRKSVKMSTVLIYQLKCNERDKMQKKCDYICLTLIIKSFSGQIV